MVIVLAIVVAAGCLLVGVTSGNGPLVWLAGGVSVIGAALLVAMLLGVRLPSRPRADRADLAPESESPAESESTPAESESTPAEAESPAESESTPKAESTPNGEPAPDPEYVWVIPDRRRFHVTGCRLLADKPAEEISLAEAREEGFTACTSCVPDRAALGAPS